MDFRNSDKSKIVFLVCFGLYIDVLRAPMRFSVIFYIYEHNENIYVEICLKVWKILGANISEQESENEK